MNQLDQVENTIWFRFNFDWVNSVRFVFFLPPLRDVAGVERKPREREEKGFSLGQRERQYWSGLWFRLSRDTQQNVQEGGGG